MSLWMFPPIPDGHVALRLRHVHDRPRRFTLHDNGPAPVSEEWRCSGCSTWLARDSVTLVESGRVVAGAPEVAAYCASCRVASRPTAGR